MKINYHERAWQCPSCGKYHRARTSKGIGERETKKVSCQNVTKENRWKPCNFKAIVTVEVVQVPSWETHILNCREDNQ